MWDRLSPLTPAITRRHLRRPLVFVVVAFLHRRSTFRRNEARFLRTGRRRFSAADQFLGAPPVFIRARRERLPATPQLGLSAAARSVTATTNRSAVALRRMTFPPSACLPRAGRDSLENRDGTCKIHAPRHTVKRFLEKICDKNFLRVRLWKSVGLWKTFDSTKAIKRPKTAGKP